MGGDLQLQRGSHVLQYRQALGQPLTQRCAFIHAAGLLQAVPDFFKEQGIASPALQTELATEQVKGLDALCALMNRVQAVVTVQLLQRVFAGVTRATEYLDPQIGGHQAISRRPGLDHRGQQIQ
ncbi:hypothetical protein D3C84_706190 [compost metagenome]